MSVLATQAPPQPVLPPRYYRDNFFTLCEVVESRYGDLLSGAEQAWLGQLRAQPEDAQCLFIRLLCRTGPSFRTSRLRYPEIGDLEPALDSLLGTPLLAAETALNTGTMAQLFTRQELVAAYRGELDRIPARKPELVESISALGESGEERLQRLLAAGERVVTPQGAEYLLLLQLLFFGNHRQSLTDFVLSDLGLFHYYPYDWRGAQPLFACREAVDEFLACARLAQQYRERREQGDEAAAVETGRALLEVQPGHATSVYRWSRSANLVARDLEREQEFDLAISLYRNSRVHPARARLARVLEIAGRAEEALVTCAEIAASPWCEAEKSAAGRIERRLHRSLGLTPPESSGRAPKPDVLVLPQTGERVEIAAAEALSQDWEAVLYVENLLHTGLFGLAFWDVLFAPVPGAFHHPFQSAPADLHDPAFRERRQAQIAAQLEVLQQGDLAATLRRQYRRCNGYSNHWVEWRWFSEPLIDAAVACIRREHLLAIWQRILFDPRENRAGFPDLFAFDTATGRCELIEVKGPGDRLQENQRRWLQFFRDIGLPARTVQVSWADD